EFHMLTDPGRRHAMMVNEHFEFAVLEYEAPGLPGYFFSDLDGDWSGRHARLGWNSTELRDAWLLCDEGVCDSEDTGGTFETLWLDGLDEDYGLYFGEFVGSHDASGSAGAVLRSDPPVAGPCTA